ncbi:hypothetical protein QBC34DRAFT_436637 [Podospora aff. communis PSN243]|uniref:MARVEL domain-containing protein n=1 Tax=Podospora aff. communis PSN243 TaxID=3040156 RepID=A0AAV9GV79_9PEZI|nr:hypothetical protein QBC34DRAFT_436637 [Podospora aff. communis PSN243]
MTDIGRAFLTKAWIFQAIIASPNFILLGAEAMFAVWEPTYWTVYDFITFSFTATMAGGIIFLVLVQRQLPNAGKLWTFRFELAKAAIATGLWIWLMADALWGPSRRRGWNDDFRIRRVIMSAISVNVLFVFFYPTAVYTFVLLDRQQHEDGAAVEAGRGQVDENTPLLGDEA